MKITLRSLLLAAVLVGGLTMTSCKKETEATTETETETTVEGRDTITTTETEVDENGAKDTMSVTRDTVVVKKP